MEMLFLGRLGISYHELYHTSVASLYRRLRGWRKQKRDDLETQRMLMVEQTVNLMNATGNMKKPVTYRDFGIDVKTGSSHAQTREEIEKEIQIANSIEWRVG